jgi:hypothetical protein
MSNPRPLPELVVDRLFSRFAAIFGAQKVGAMWADGDIAEVKGVWAQALSRYQSETIGLALQRLIDGGDGWPPTLPEFVEICRQASLARHNAAPPPALPAPGAGYTDAETAKKRVAELMSSLTKSKRVSS